MAIDAHPRHEPDADMEFDLELLRSKTSELTAGMWIGITLAFIALALSVVALFGMHRRGVEIANLNHRLATADSLLQATQHNAAAAQSRIAGLTHRQAGMATQVASLQSRSRMLAAQLATVGERASRADSTAVAAAQDTAIAGLTGRLGQRVTQQAARLDSLQAATLASQVRVTALTQERQLQSDQQRARIDQVASSLKRYQRHHLAWDAASFVGLVFALTK
jgi:hypothetical protein